jgi:hypothetical protein
MATARRDTLLELQAKAQKKWADEKTFEVTAPRDGTCDLVAPDFPSRRAPEEKSAIANFSGARRVGPGRPGRPGRAPKMLRRWSVFEAARSRDTAHRGVFRATYRHHRDHHRVR